MAKSKALLFAGALLAVLVVVLAFGSGTRSKVLSPAERATRLAERVKCPTCLGQSVAESRAGASRAIYQEMQRRARAGQSDSEILGYIESRYGKAQLLLPERTGVASAVWILPVVVLFGAMFGLGIAFRRWKAPQGLAPTEEDRELVAAALHNDVSNV